MGRTHMIGKWHQGFYAKAFVPTSRGFDSFFGFYDGGESYFTHITPFSVWNQGAPYSWTPFQDVNASRWKALVDLSNETSESGPQSALHSLNGSFSIDAELEEAVRII